jgi:hypothetical protein
MSQLIKVVLLPLSTLWRKSTILENLTTLKKTKETYENLETHTMPPPRVINKGHLIQELMPIHTSEDPYMIQLLGRQSYIDIVFNAPIGWEARVCSSLKFGSSLLFYHFVCVGLLLLVILCLCHNPSLGLATKAKGLTRLRAKREARK